MSEILARASPFAHRMGTHRSLTVTAATCGSPSYGRTAGPFRILGLPGYVTLFRWRL